MAIKTIKKPRKATNTKTKLRWIMELEGINSAFVCKRIGISSSYMRLIMRKPELASEEKLQAIAKVLNRPYDEVFGDMRPLPQIAIAVPQQAHIS